MSRIEDAVAAVRYEKDPCYPYRYDQETVDEIEAMVGRPLPEDMRWYLLNVGRLGLEYDHNSLLVRRGEALLNLRFKGVEDQVFAKSRYGHFLERKEGGLLPGDMAHYYPLCDIEGETYPSVSLRLLIDLNDGASYGSIWGVRPIGYYDDQTPSQPIRIADDLAAFLGQIGSERSLRDKAEKHNEALFKRLFGDYLAAPASSPTDAADGESLLQHFFAHREETRFDGLRNVELDHYVRGRRFETAQELTESVETLATSLPTNPFHGSTGVHRQNIKFGRPEAYSAGFGSDRLTPGFTSLTVTSTIGDGLKFSETYLLFQDRKAGVWTILRRLDGVIANVKIKDVGTFGFDSTYKWHLKKKVTPAWAEFRSELTVDGEEAALTPQVIAFIQEISGKAEFRSVFEEHVFRLYKDRYYPDFEAMDAEEKKDWAKDFPDIANPSAIWSLFGKKASIHVHGENAFTLRVDAGFDPEHGLDLRVEDWRIVG